MNDFDFDAALGQADTFDVLVGLIETQLNYIKDHDVCDHREDADGAAAQFLNDALDAVANAVYLLGDDD